MTCLQAHVRLTGALAKIFPEQMWLNSTVNVEIRKSINDCFSTINRMDYFLSYFMVMKQEANKMFFRDEMNFKHLYNNFL